MSWGGGLVRIGEGEHIRTEEGRDQGREGGREDNRPCNCCRDKRQKTQRPPAAPVPPPMLCSSTHPQGKQELRDCEASERDAQPHAPGYRQRNACRCTRRIQREGVSGYALAGQANPIFPPCILWQRHSGAGRRVTTEEGDDRWAMGISRHRSRDGAQPGPQSETPCAERGLLMVSWKDSLRIFKECRGSVIGDAESGSD